MMSEGEGGGDVMLRPCGSLSAAGVRNWAQKEAGMSSRRVIVHDWLSRETAADGYGRTGADSDGEIEGRVRRALAMLSEDERELMVRFYYMGCREQEIAEATGLTVARVCSVRRRATGKFRRLLGPFVRERFAVDVAETMTGCPICDSTFREEIDLLIARRDRRGTWRPVMQAIWERYGIRIPSPQMLMGHERNH
jgi:hypothetical protein